MKYCTVNGVFSLIPKEVYTKRNGENILRDQFNLSKDAIIKSLEIPDFNGVLVYNDDYQSNDGTQAFPIITELIRIIKYSVSYNKVIIHFSAKHKMAHLIICTLNKLELITSYKSETFDTALYYLLLSLKNLQINNIQTSLRVCNEVTDKQMEVLTKYFRKVTIIDLSTDITLV